MCTHPLVRHSPARLTGAKSWFRAFACLLLIAYHAPVAVCRGESLAEDKAAIDVQFAAEIEKLAVSCEQNNLIDKASQTRAWLPKPDPWRMHLIDPPAKVGSREAIQDQSPLTADWRAAFNHIRREHAEKLFALAERALNEKQPCLALELVRGAIRQNPDHEESRRVLGYSKSGDLWQTPFEIAQAKQGLVWHDRFGWLRRDQIERYEQGERRSGNRWISAADDASAHSDIAKGWQIETEHYRVTTNHSLEAGAKLANELEFLYRAWRQVFLRYYASDKDIAAQFKAKTPKAGKPRRHEVIYFRDQAEYKQHLRGSVPDDFVTTGIYIGEQKTAYFYSYQPTADAEANELANEDHTTLYHEATHQLFSETKPGVREPASQANFWIVEGVACYMETLARADDVCTVGGNEGDRFLSAQHWLGKGDYYLPLAELSLLGQEPVQRHDRLATLYSQSTGLVHFLMHYRDGVHRDALMRFLEAVYSGRDRPSTLAELTGVDYKTLDQQYREFMQPE